MNKTYKQNFLKAGALAGLVRSFGKSLIVKGASYNEVISKINQKIGELGAIAAFPPQMALNDVAAHFLPDPGSDIIFSDEVVKLDIGVCYKGAIGDCAVTVDLSQKNQNLIDAAESALLAAEKIIKVGLPIREIGKIIEETIHSYGLRPIKNLCGHGLGVNQIHTDPSIPNYNDNSKGLIRPGMTFAIEPFATNGFGLIYEDGKANIYSMISKRAVSSALDKEILKKIIAFNGLPFASHDLKDDRFSFEEVEKSLNSLTSLGVIHGYGPLLEKKKGLVAQAENSVLVDDAGEVFITTRLQ